MTCNIGLVAIGSRGDVQPMLAIALAMKRNKEYRCDPFIVTHINFIKWIESFDIRARPIQISIEEMSNKPEMAEAIANGDTLKYSRQVLSKEGSQQTFDDIRQGCHDADCLVANATAVLFAAPLAESKIIAIAVVGLGPFHPTGDFLPLIGKSLWFRWMNRWAHGLMRTLMWQGGGGSMVQYCRKRLNLSPTTCEQYNDYVDKMPWFYGFSSIVIPLPRDWPANVKIGGFLFLTAQDSGISSLEPGMESFLASHPNSPPIYVGFGSMPTGLTQRFFALVEELLKESDAAARFIIYVGGTKLSKEAPDTETAAARRYHETWKATGRVHLAMSTPHDLLFPRCRVIVHHGGAGTTASALKSKRPQVICPFFADQPFWASKIGELGVGPPLALPFRKVTGKALWDAIQRIDSEPAITKAKDVGHVIASEDAAREAAEWLLRQLIPSLSRTQ